MPKLIKRLYDSIPRKTKAVIVGQRGNPKYKKSPGLILVRYLSAKVVEMLVASLKDNNRKVMTNLNIMHDEKLTG